MNQTILVVDDSASIRAVVRVTLQRAGYFVVEATDGNDALGKLDEPKPGLIVCDVHMPNLDGLSFVRQVKATAAHRSTPVIMLSTETQESKKAEGRAAGARAWITKPFHPSQLIDVVNRLCA